MNDDSGVFLNPNSGDIIATGQISASSFKIPTERDIIVGQTPLVDLLKYENVIEKVYSQDGNTFIESDIQSLQGIINVTNNVNLILSNGLSLDIETATFEDVCENISAIYSHLHYSLTELSDYDVVYDRLNYIVNDSSVLSNAYTLKFAVDDLRLVYAKKVYVEEQIEYSSGLIKEDYALSIEGLTEYSDNISSDLSTLRVSVADIPQQLSSTYATKTYVREYVEEHGSAVTIRTWTN